MPTYSSALLPTTNGLALGSSALRWTAYIQDIDVTGSFTSTSRLGTKNLDGILFADQFTGATVGDQIDAAVTAAVGGLVVAPPDMGAGFGVVPGLLLDLRSGQFSIYSNGYVTANFALASAGITSGAFISGTASVAGTGTIRMAATDTLKFRFGVLDKTALSFSGATVIVGASGGGVQLPGPIAFSGALTGITTLSASGQITSTLATGTAPFSITSTTVVPNLNVATLNGVTVSGAPTTGQALVATGVATAGWAGSATTYKFENYSVTPSAAAQPFSWTVPANEIAVGQSFRVIAHGVFSNGSTASNMTIVLKTGATTLATVTFGATGAGAITNFGWRVEFLVTCTVAGVGGTVESSGFCMGAISVFPSLAASGNTSTVAFDTTTSAALTLNISATNSGAWSARQWIVERLG